MEGAGACGLYPVVGLHECRYLGTVANVTEMSRILIGARMVVPTAQSGGVIDSDLFDVSNVSLEFHFSNTLTSDWGMPKPTAAPRRCWLTC